MTLPLFHHVKITLQLLHRNSKTTGTDVNRRLVSANRTKNAVSVQLSFSKSPWHFCKCSVIFPRPADGHLKTEPFPLSRPAAAFPRSSKSLVTVKELLRSICPAELCPPHPQPPTPTPPAVKGEEKTDKRKRIRFHTVAAAAAYRVIVDHLLQALCELHEAGLREQKHSKSQHSTKTSNNSLNMQIVFIYHI